MYFAHAAEIWTDFPELVPGVLAAQGVTPDVDVKPRLEQFTQAAASRLATQSEGELPEVQAWRRCFSRLGLKPTQYRCASESLLRRFKREGALPALHPLVDLCNAISMAFAIPVAVFDVAKIDGGLEVRRATGSEVFETFSGETEHPDPGEVVFADAAGRAHARRWTNRQSGYSAVREETASVLIVAEALHASARADVDRLVETVAGELDSVWGIHTTPTVLTSDSPRLEF
jgi:DNA/RNA-binding domain of Phe-tRNA-synthetase-like protein